MLLVNENIYTKTLGKCKTSTQVFYGEYCKILSKDIYFEEYLRTTTSEYDMKVKILSQF